MKAIVYTLAAVALGMLVITAPVYMLMMTEKYARDGSQEYGGGYEDLLKAFSTSLERMEDWQPIEHRQTATQSPANREIEFLAVSFIIASAAYLIIHRKFSNRKYPSARLF